MNLQPWLRQVEVTLGPLQEWRQKELEQGPADEKAVRIYSNGSRESLRIRFRINKHGSGVPMPSTIEIYNLGPDFRSVLQTPGIAISVKVGWLNGELTELFSGGVQAAWSRKEGTDVITTISCLTASYALGTSIIGFDKVATTYFAPGSYLGSQNADGNGESAEVGVIAMLASALRGVIVDTKNIYVPDKVIGSRGYTSQGQASECLNELARAYGFSWTVNDGAFQAVTDGLYIPGRTVDINSANGFLIRAEPILNSAFQQQAGIIVHSLLNPLVQPARIVNVESVINPDLNGSYYSQSVMHSGDTHSSSWETVSETYLVHS